MPPDEPTAAELAAAAVGADSVDHHDEAKPSKPRWPDLPGHGADLDDIRGYLTTAANLPVGYLVERCVRHGPEGTDAMVLVIRTPGDADDIRVRFEHQDHAGKASTLRSAMARQTSGLARMAHPSPAKAADFHTMCCALAAVQLVSTVADETRQCLGEFLRHTRPVAGFSLSRSEDRYDALQKLRATGEFERPQAQRMVRGELADDELPVVLIDKVTAERWIRAGELATYLRHVHGGFKGGLSQSTLDSRLAEIGVPRVRMEVRRGGEHPDLVLYRLAPEGTE